MITKEMVEAAVAEVRKAKSEGVWDRWTDHDAVLAMLESALGEPVGEQWCVCEEGEQRTSWYYVGQREGDAPGWGKLAAACPETYEIKTRRLYAGPVVEASE